MIDLFEIIDRLFAWALNLDDKFTFISPKVKDLLGYEPSEILFKTPYIFMSSKEGNEFAQKIKFHKENVTAFWIARINLLKKNGDNILLEVNVLAKYDNKKQISGFEGIAFEVK